MESFTNTLNREANALERRIAKDWAYFYTIFKDDYSSMRNVLFPGNKKFFDFTQGNFMKELGKRPAVTRYNVLEAQINDAVSDFYHSIRLSAPVQDELLKYKSRAKAFTAQFERDKERAMQSAVKHILPVLFGHAVLAAKPADVLMAIKNVLSKRINTLQGLLDGKCRQLNQYMLLWQYQDMGYERYLFLAEGENCEACNGLDGAIFSIADAKVGENLAPMHPNCDCAAAVLDESGSVVAIVIGKDNFPALRAKLESKNFSTAVGAHFYRLSEKLVGSALLLPFAAWMPVVNGILQGGARTLLSLSGGSAAKNRLKAIAYLQYPRMMAAHLNDTAAQMIDYRINISIARVENHKSIIRQVSNTYGVPAEIIGGIIFKEQLTQSIPDIAGNIDTLYINHDLHSTGLGAIGPDTARKAWKALDKNMPLPATNTELQLKLTYDTEFNIRSIAAVLIYYGMDKKYIGHPSQAKNMSREQWKVLVGRYNAKDDNPNGQKNYSDKVYEYLEDIEKLLNEEEDE